MHWNLPGMCEVDYSEDSYNGVRTGTCSQASLPVVEISLKSTVLHLLELLAGCSCGDS